LLVSTYSGNGRISSYDVNSFQGGLLSYLGDFAGQIGLLAGQGVVAGSAGNPHLGGGTVGVFDLGNQFPYQYFASPLADNLTTSPATNEVFVASGASLGIDVLL